jgi:uncharacterized NAD(P)/FAD-binding protein YdhS
MPHQGGVAVRQATDTSIPKQIIGFKNFVHSTYGNIPQKDALQSDLQNNVFRMTVRTGASMMQRINEQATALLVGLFLAILSTLLNQHSLCT